MEVRGDLAEEEPERSLPEGSVVDRKEQERWERKRSRGCSRVRNELW